MPIHEFYSPDTNKIYTFFARRMLPSDSIPRCPDGKRLRMEKMISRFSFTGRAKEPMNGGGETELDSRQEAELMRIAGEMESFGNAEPDPRALGSMMRRMIDITGTKPPPEMQEMLQRLEKGEDPEKLEAEFGYALGDFDESEEGGASLLGKTLRKHLRKAPERDPVLYEMSDFLN